MTLLRLSIIATFVLNAASSAMPAIRGPYDVDEHTLHLYHFDAESRVAKKTMAPDAAGLDSALGLAFQNGAKRTRGFQSAFGSAIDTSTASTARLMTLKPMPQSTFWNRQTGAFTYEAIVQMDFDPRKFLEDRPSRMQILSVDNDESGVTRGFWLSLRPIGVHGATAPSLEFVKIGSGEYGPRVQAMVAVLPSSGLHSPIPEAWFHVAVSYDGNEGKRDNLKIYWTRVAPEVTAANLVYLASLDRDPPPDAMLSFSVGNRVRSNRSSRNQNENWLGKIDEVRISSVARRPQEFLFSETGVATALKGAEK